MSSSSPIISGYPRVGFETLRGGPSSTGPNALFKGRRQCLKYHHRPRWVTLRVQSSQQCPAHPPGQLPQACQVIYGPLALPGSYSRWMGSAEGWAQSQEPGAGWGRCLAPEKAIPGRPPSLKRAGQGVLDLSQAWLPRCGPPYREVQGGGGFWLLMHLPRPQFPHL